MDLACWPKLGKSRGHPGLLDQSTVGFSCGWDLGTWEFGMTGDPAAYAFTVAAAVFLSFSFVTEFCTYLLVPFWLPLDNNF